MSTMAMCLVSRETILNAARPAERDLKRTRASVSFALTIVGGLLDMFGSMVLGQLNKRLERDTLLFRGLRSAIDELDGMVIDPSLEGIRVLSSIEEHIAGLRVKAQKGTGTPELQRTHEAFLKLISLCDAMRDASVELRKAIAEHDCKVQVASDDAKRLIADLRRTDDVPAGQYASVAALLCKTPQSADQDSSGDPRPN